MKAGSLGKIKKYEEVTVSTPNDIAKYREKGFRRRKKKRRGQIVLRRMKSHWQLFEDEVLLLLQNGLELTDVYGGPRARLGGHQIDAAGGVSEKYIVVECKSSDSPSYSNVRRAIKDIIGEQREIRRGLRARFGRRYKKIRFALALNGIDYTQKEEEYAERNGITIWSSVYLETLVSLCKLIGPRVKYTILREMGMGGLPIKEGRGRYYRIPAFSFVQDGQQGYMFLMKARRLLDLAYVSRIETGQKNAFQRLLAKKKLESVAAFIDEGGLFKNNIVVNFGQVTKPRFSRKETLEGKHKAARLDRGILRIPKQYCSVWLVDGQHRLYGYTKSKDGKKLNNWLPVIALEDPDGTAAASVFVEINKNQKPVDPNILWALSSEIVKGDPVIISNVIKDLTLQPRSLFRNKIYYPGVTRQSKRAYKIYLANFAKGLSDRRLLERVRMLSSARKGRLTEEEGLRKVLSQYFSMLHGTLVRGKQQKWWRGFVLSNNGLNVMLRVLHELLIYCDSTFPAKEVKNLIQKPLLEYCANNSQEIDELRRKASSEATREEIATEVIATINRYSPDFGAKYLRRRKRTLKQADPDEVLESLENCLRRFIEEALSAVDDDWWKQRIPGAVKARAEERMEKNECPWPWHSRRDLTPIYYVDFGDYESIITSRRNWNEAFQAVFKNKTILSSALLELNPIRNARAHHRDLSLDEIDQLHVSARKIKKSIENWHGRYPRKKELELQPA